MNQLDDLPIGMMDQSEYIVARYRRMIDEGQSSRLAEMLAVRKAPRLDTDVVHNEGLTLAGLAKTAGPEYVKKIVKQAKQAGISVNDNSFFNGAIADERQGADPEAWLLTGDGKDKLKRTVRSRGGASPELGVDFGESTERSDKEQARLEKVRTKNKKFREMRDQLKHDMATGSVPELKQKA